MDYVLLAAWCFLVALGGGLVGLVLGNVRLPAVLDEEPRITAVILPFSRSHDGDLIFSGDFCAVFRKFQVKFLGIMMILV